MTRNHSNLHNDSDRHAGNKLTAKCPGTPVTSNAYAVSGIFAHPGAFAITVA